MRIFFLIAVLVSFFSSAQTGIGTSLPDPSSVLDINDSSKGFLPPRMTNFQKSNIGNPAQGLMVYCTDCGVNGELQIFNGINWTNLIGLTPAQSVPGSPTNVLATVANAQSSVSFTVPISDGGSSITGYTVTSSPGGFTVSGTSSPIVVTGLTNGTAYTFTVVATNAIGNSTGATSASVTPELPITAAPTNLFALPGNNVVTFSYVAPSGTVSGYNIEYKAVSATVWTSLPVTTTSTLITGLTNNVAYEFKVGATNLTGAGPVSSSVMIEPVSQPIIFTENFNASTFDTTKWLEKETTTAQIGATVGDITLSNGQLSAKSTQTGGSQWATRYLKTNSTFARANGDLVFQMDVTYTDCTSSNTNSFFYWGPIQTTGGSIAAGTSTSAATIINRLNSNGAFKMFTYGPIEGATTGTTSTSTASACTNSITTHFKIVVKQAGGVDVYRNGESTPSLSHTATQNFASRDNYPLSIMPAGDVDAMRVDNIVVCGSPSINSLLAPSYLLVTPRNTSALLQWFSADYATDYQIEYKETQSNNWITVTDGVNTNLGFTVTGLVNGTSYDFRVTSIGASSTSLPTNIISAIPSLIEFTNFNNQILTSGQSLSTGVSGAPRLSSVQPFNNLMLSSDNLSLIPLVEPNTNAHATNLETMSSGLANSLTALINPAHNFKSIVSLHGKSSEPYSVLKKNTVRYNLGMNQVKNAMKISLGSNTPIRVFSLAIVHGEDDEQDNKTAAQYESYLVEWQSDYNNDVKKITGQNDNVIMFTDQMSSWTYYSKTRPRIALGQWNAAKNNPNNIILVTPKYILDYVTDGIHLNNYSYRRLGEYYGKVMKKVLIDKQPWLPLSPNTISRSGNIITINFNVPNPPLQFDTQAVLFKSNYGFEFINSENISITNVSLGTSGTSVVLTLSAIPTLSAQVAYAYTGTAGSPGNGLSGRLIAGAPRGNLCDSDTTQAYYQDNLVPTSMGNTLKNWCITFLENVN